MISFDSILVILGMLCVTYGTRLIGFFALRNRTLSKRAAKVMDAAPGCVLVSVIAPLLCLRQTARTDCRRHHPPCSLPPPHAAHSHNRCRLLRPARPADELKAV